MPTGTRHRIDFAAYPPTAFPFRDLLILNQLALSPTDVACEIGVGSGGTAARLARICHEVVGVEISAPTVQALRCLEDSYPNLRFVVADATAPETLAEHAGHFTKVISCDTLEHVRDPATFFRSAALLLAPGGSMLITFPNEPAHRMHGITRFDDPAQLAALVRSAGFDGLRIGAANLSAWSRPIARTFGIAPIQLVHTLTRRSPNGPGNAPRDNRDLPQQFDETHFFKHMGVWRRLSPLLNAYWFGVLRLMEARGPAFDIDWDFARTSFTTSQVVVLARRDPSGQHRNRSHSPQVRDRAGEFVPGAPQVAMHR